MGIIKRLLEDKIDARQQEAATGEFASLAKLMEGVRIMQDQGEFFKPAEFKDHPPEFEAFWQAYPRRKGKRVGKGAALRLWHKLKPAEQCEALEAAKNYARSDAAQRGYARDADRFLKADWWRDWVEGPGEVNERDRLISRLKAHVGEKCGESVIVSTGLEGMHAERPWADFSLPELKAIIGRLGR